jgi:tetratricopeptide (TPR) repeat protein
MLRKIFLTNILALSLAASVAFAAPGGQAYKEGKSFYEDSNYGKAIEMFQKALSENPEHYAGKSNYMIALCYKKMGQCNKAAIFFKKALDGDSKNAGASSMAKFEDQLKDCGLSKSGLAQISTAEIPADAVVAPAVGADPFLQEYAMQAANGSKLIDLTGALTADDKKILNKQIENFADENVSVYLAVSKSSVSAPDELLQAIGKAAQASASNGDLLVVLVAGDKIYGKLGSKKINTAMIKRAAQKAEPFALKAISDRSGQGVMAEKFFEDLMQQNEDSESAATMGSWGKGIFALALIGGGVFWIIQRRKKQAEVAAQEENSANEQLGQIQDVLFNDTLWLDYATSYNPDRVQQVQLGLQLEYSQLVESKDPVAINELQRRLRQLQSNPNSIFAALNQ